MYFVSIFIVHGVCYLQVDGQSIFVQIVQITSGSSGFFPSKSFLSYIALQRHKNLSGHNLIVVCFLSFSSMIPLDTSSPYWRFINEVKLSRTKIILLSISGLLIRGPEIALDISSTTVDIIESSDAAKFEVFY